MAGAAGTNWTELEVRAAIRAYFELLEADIAGEKINKASVYRSLAAKFPNRSPKAFEFKFANISAVLFEEGQRFVRGLLPRSNYQALLKALVLQELAAEGTSRFEPYEELFRHLEGLRRRGEIAVKGTGDGRYGAAIEAALGIQANSSKDPDFMGIELKTHSTNGRQTLFALAPSEYPAAKTQAAMFESNHRLVDGVQRFAKTITSKGDETSLRLRRAGKSVEVTRGESVQMRWTSEKLEASLIKKHARAAFIAVKPVQKGANTTIRIVGASFCETPSILRFLDFVDEGRISLDISMSRKGESLSNHGFLWRVDRDALKALYHSSREMKFSEPIAAAS